MHSSKFLEIAKKAAIEAGKIVKKYSGREHIYKQKKHIHDFATEADIESEKIVIEIIRKEFPKHNIIAEEGGSVDNGSEYSWAIDPIDGTVSFVMGMPFYSVSVGLLQNGIPIAGAVNVVGLDELFWAEKDGGAFLNGEPIQVSSRNTVNTSALSLDVNWRSRAENIEHKLKPFINDARAIFMLGGAAFEMVYVARGFLDGTILEAHPWDFAAGAVILSEAGGRVSDRQGKQIDFLKERIYLVASNGLIHNEVIETLNKK